MPVRAHRGRRGAQEAPVGAARRGPLQHAGACLGGLQQGRGHHRRGHVREPGVEDLREGGRNDGGRLCAFGHGGAVQRQPRRPACHPGRVLGEQQRRGPRLHELVLGRHPLQRGLPVLLPHPASGAGHQQARPLQALPLLLCARAAGAGFRLRRREGHQPHGRGVARVRDRVCVLFRGLRGAAYRRGREAPCEDDGRVLGQLREDV
mmetsp:Transcript_43853/g.136531  ORF Transcript_43853/g.136531 Transcript_43853/m.136531 type:complete len:206 (+) Transcript_43853:1001-1618(+)